ncbi:T9SS type A sorting domain-containing protein [Flavobacteriaceae sp. LMIT009]
MKKPLLLGITFLFIAFSFQSCKNEKANYEYIDQELSVDELRHLHQQHLENSPFQNFSHLSKKERKSKGLPPNGYFERQWELTLDPRTGRPMPEKVSELQENLRAERALSRGVGGDGSNPWVERGPNDIPGRTRAIMFDPNDSGNLDPADDYTRVFAGSVSGGLWVNDDITDANSSWSRVAGIPDNISVVVIISDPNNSNTFYLGSGESYTSGDGVGTGIWKSTDGGVTWSNVLGGYTGMSGSQLIQGIFYVNDLVARDIGGGNTELYAAIAGAFYGESSSPSQFHGLQEQGLYKSVNNGASWTKFTINEANGSPSNPNDIEIDINNNIWFTTTRSNWGFAGGKIYRSTNGTSFTLMHTIANANRTELETSQNSANTLWVLANVNSQADIWTTTDAFTTPVQITTEPNDADLGIPATDFTRGQAFYDLEIEADASDNLIIGGINLFRSTDNGATWSQISKWANNANMNLLSVSLVHADQQAIVFRPGAGNGNKLAFGTDGGIYYTDDITLASTSTTAIVLRSKDYATTQFYYGDISSVIGGANDDIIGGTQDNGTPLLQDGGAGINGFTDITGGDGGYSEIDTDASFITTAYPRNTHYALVPPSTFYPITTSTPPAIGAPNCNSDPGSFINEAALDKNLDILYSNASYRTFVCATGATVSNTYRIERSSNLKSGAVSVVNTMLTNGLLNGSPTAFKVSPFTGGATKLFVGLENGRLLRIDNADGGVAPSWNDITGAFVGSISDIEFGENENEIFVTMFNYGVTSVWFTNNGGTSWSSKEGNLPDLPVKCILQNPLEPNEVIIGTKLGVWATLDYTQGSPTWTQVNNGMNEVEVMDLDLRTADNVILASTYGRGMFTSQFTSNLGLEENNFSQSIKLYPNPVQEDLHIKLTNSLGANATYRIHNILGQTITQGDLKDESLNVSSLNTGLYFIEINVEGKKGVKRFIKQ